ncbi:CinA family nicotinamide mononucleotide deamidase-related protein [Lentisphaerota bacterium WC36G]|nr:CinA family nicotinamide mononucleotide deamidase-related protein [Lentisphaerae bacterium WC36]
MKILYICIGNELLRGVTLNKNLSTIGQKLLEYNIELTHQITIGDSYAEINDAIKNNLHLYDVIITTGGLGPTSDDITKEAIAKTIGLPLEQDLTVKKYLEKLWHKRFKCQPSSNQLKQSYFPKGAEIIANYNGSAPGCHVKYINESVKCDIFIFPGPPNEMIPMLNGYFSEYLDANNGEQICNCYYLCDVPESNGEAIVSKILKDNNLTEYINVAYCAEPRLLKVFFSASKEFQSKLIKVEQIFTEKFSNNFLSLNVTNLPEEIIAICLDSEDRKLTLSVAESCTGGLIGGEITKCSGASDIFKGGILAYSNEIKSNVLGIDSSIIENFGAVSEEVAIDMVDKCQSLFDTDCAISVTGIAGPTGGTKEKPVGLVYIGVKFKDNISVKEYRFRGDRVSVRRQTVQSALSDLRSLIKELNK